MFVGTKFQRCTTHLKRSIISDVCNGNWGNINPQQVFRHRGQELYGGGSLGAMTGVVQQMGDNITGA